MTKRLFAYIGLTMLITFTVVFYFPTYALYFTIPLGVVLFSVSLIFINRSGLRRTLGCVGVVVVLSSMYITLYSGLTANRADKYDGMNIYVEATVISNPREYRDNYFYELETSSVNDREEHIKITLTSSKDLGAEFGDTVSSLISAKKATYNYSVSKGFLLTAYTDGGLDSFLEVKKGKVDFLRDFPHFLQTKLTFATKQLIYGEPAELCNAVSLGDRYSMNDELYGAFKNTGLSYYIVVSGMHMSIIASFLQFLFRIPLKLHYRAGIVSSLFIISLVLLYLTVTGFGVSAVRAAIMIIVVHCGLPVFRKSDSFNNLGFAAMLITIVNPYSVGDVGMLLSFGATAGILYLYPKIMDRYLRKFPRDKERTGFYGILYYCCTYLTAAFVVSFSAIVFILPLTVIFFGSYHPLVFIYSIFIAPVISTMMAFSLLSSLLFYVPIASFLSIPLAYVAEIIAKYIICVVRFLNKLHFIQFFIDEKYAQLWAGFTLIVIFLAFLFSNRKRSITAAIALSLTALILSSAVDYINYNNKTILSVFYSGKGNTVLLSNKEGDYVLSCGGKYKYYSDISGEILRLTNNFNMLIVPSSREYDGGYAENILETFDVKKVLMYYNDIDGDKAFLKKSKETAELSIINLNRTYELDFGDDVSDTILNIRGYSWQYVRLGKTTVLVMPFNGNVEELPEKYRTADYAVVNENNKNTELLSCGKFISGEYQSSGETILTVDDTVRIEP